MTKVLNVIAGRVPQYCAPWREPFRISGDEFAVVPDGGDGHRTKYRRAFARRSCTMISASSASGADAYQCRPGIARMDDLDDLQNLQWKADVAMYQAKRPGHANVVMRSARHWHAIPKACSSWVTRRVYDAVVYGAKGLEMHYQPIVDRAGQGNILALRGAGTHRTGWRTDPCLPNIFPVVEARRSEVELDRRRDPQGAGGSSSRQVQLGTGVSINLSGPSVVHDQVVPGSGTSCRC